MGTRIAVLVSILALVGCGAEGSDGMAEAAQRQGELASAFDDPEVARVWSGMMETIAPDGGWERARYIEFDWAVNRGDGEPTVRRHRWDRWEGTARVETGGDRTVVAIFDTDDPEAGRVWIDGEEVTGEAASERLRSAHRAHINDGYWLLMPYKWTDPGVHARYVGEHVDDEGRRWEAVELTFDDGTGLTPRNMYWGLVNPETNRMERWHHHSNPDANPSPSDWTEWRRVGPIELAENRGSGGQVRIFFPHLRVETEVPDGAFEAPGS